MVDQHFFRIILCLLVAILGTNRVEGKACSLSGYSATLVSHIVKRSFVKSLERTLNFVLQEIKEDRKSRISEYLGSSKGVYASLIQESLTRLGRMVPKEDTDCGFKSSEIVLCDSITGSVSRDGTDIMIMKNQVSSMDGWDSGKGALEPNPSLVDMTSLSLTLILSNLVMSGTLSTYDPDMPGYNKVNCYTCNMKGEIVRACRLEKFHTITKEIVRETSKYLVTIPITKVSKTTYSFTISATTTFSTNIVRKTESVTHLTSLTNVQVTNSINITESHREKKLEEESNGIAIAALCLTIFLLLVMIILCIYGAVSAKASSSVGTS